MDVSTADTKPLDNIMSESEQTANTIAEENSDDYLTIRYNHEDIKLTKEQAQQLSQKGLNYDKIYSQLKELKNDEKDNAEKDENKFEKLFAKFPGLTIENLPDEVILCDDGCDIVAAYEKYSLKKENEELNRKLKEIALQAAKAKSDRVIIDSTPKNINGVRRSYNSDVFSKDELNCLTKDDIANNLDKAILSMSFWSKKD